MSQWTAQDIEAALDTALAQQQGSPPATEREPEDRRVKGTLAKSTDRRPQQRNENSQVKRHPLAGTGEDQSNVPRVSMAERSGFPQLDEAIAEFMQTHPELEDYRDPQIAWGQCEVIAKQCAEFLNQRGFKAYCCSDDLRAFPGYEKAQGSDAIGAGDFSYPEHSVVEVYGLYGPNNVNNVTIDFTASQYGFGEFPKVHGGPSEGETKQATIPPGLWADNDDPVFGDPAARYPLYHVAPTTERSRILQHGLMASQPTHDDKWEDLGPGYLEDQPQGVYGWQSREHANDFVDSMKRKGIESDVWGIHPKGLVTQPEHDPLIGPARYIENSVWPEDLTLLHGPESYAQKLPDNPLPPDMMELDESDALKRNRQQWGIGMPNRVWGKQAARGEYYHVAPASYRDSILQHGLQAQEYTKTHTPWQRLKGREREQQPVGNYFWDHPEHAYQYMHGLRQRGDFPDEANSGFYFHDYGIEPGEYGESSYLRPEPPEDYHDWDYDKQDQWHEQHAQDPDNRTPYYGPDQLVQRGVDPKLHGWDIWKVRTDPDQHQILNDPEDAIHWNYDDDNENKHPSQAEAIHQMWHHPDDDEPFPDESMLDVQHNTIQDQNPPRWYSPQGIDPSHLSLYEHVPHWAVPAYNDSAGWPGEDSNQYELPDAFTRIPQQRYFGAKATKYFHTTDAELQPGDIVQPASQRGHVRQGPGTWYSPDKVYLWDAQNGSPITFQQHGQFDYEVEPLGPVEPDDEPDAGGEGHFPGSWQTTHARVIRKLPYGSDPERYAKVSGIFHQPGIWNRGLVTPTGEVHTWPESESTHNGYIFNVLGDFSPSGYDKFVVNPRGAIHGLSDPIHRELVEQYVAPPQEPVVASSAPAEVEAEEIPVEEVTEPQEAPERDELAEKVSSLTDIVAQLAAQGTKAGERRKLIVCRDEQGRISSIEEETTKPKE